MSFTNTVTQHGDLLILNGGYRPPIDLADAIAGRRFKRLRIYGKPKNLNLLSTLNHLIELRMQSTKLADFSLIAGMTRLEDLIYGIGSLKECDLSFAARSLVRLWLMNHRSLTDLTSVGVCRKLKELSLINLPRVQGYFDLASLPHLEVLELRNVRRWPSLTGLTGAKSLRKLSLDRTKIEDGVWTPLLKLKRLEYVSALEDAFGKEAAAEFRKRRPEILTPRQFLGY